jgi:hypothetical protein
VVAAAVAAVATPRTAHAQVETLSGAARYEQGRFTVLAFPGDEALARSLLREALGRDSFPGLPRPSQRILIQLAPNRRAFRDLIGEGAPEWGAAFALPAEQRIIMQGSGASSEAGDPVRVLRHELAHLALHEHLGALAPRWFDEGYASYAAGEWDREQVIATNLALAVRGVPSLLALDSGFYAGSARADAAYALAHRAVAELAALDPDRGLTLLLRYWRAEGSFERALRRAYGLTQGQFEQRFRDRTRRRYGGLALVTDVTLAAALLVFIVGPFYVIRRRRDKARLREMLAADAEAERRERESAIEQLLKQVAPSSEEGPTLRED